MMKTRKDAKIPKQLKIVRRQVKISRGATGTVFELRTKKTNAVLGKYSIEQDAITEANRFLKKEPIMAEINSAWSLYSQKVKQELVNLFDKLILIDKIERGEL